MAAIETIVPAPMQKTYEAWHFAPAVACNGMLYCSGVIGVGSNGKAIADPEAQFTAAFEGVGMVLAEAGATFADVVELTTYHVGLRDHIRVFTAVKDRYLAKPYPAWTAIGITELAVPGGLVEIRAIARQP